MSVIDEILSDEEFNKLQVPVIPDSIIGPPLMRLLEIKAFVMGDVDIMYVPNYWHVAYLVAVQQN